MWKGAGCYTGQHLAGVILRIYPMDTDHKHGGHNEENDIEGPVYRDITLSVLMVDFENKGVISMLISRTR